MVDYPLVSYSLMETYLKVLSPSSLPMKWVLTYTTLCTAVFHATIAASFTIEQLGLPRLTYTEDNKEMWNADSPLRRLEELRYRHSK